MAAKSKKQNNEVLKLTRDNRKKVWAQLPQKVWLEIAHEHKKSNQFVPAGPNRLKGCCIFPEHDDHTPSFYIDVEDGRASCYGCKRHTNDPVELVEYFLGSDKGTAISYLRDKHSITILSKKAEEEILEYKADQYMKREIYNITHSILCDTIAQPGSALPPLKKALDWLVNTRGIPVSSLHMLPIGIMPIVTEISVQARRRFTVLTKAYEKGELKYAPLDVSENINKYLASYINGDAAIGSVMFPLHTSINEIGRFKLRPITNDTSTKTFIITSDDYSDYTGIFGLGWDVYTPFLLGKDRADSIYITEGEMDALSMMAGFVTHTDVPRFPLVSVGGLGASASIEPILKGAGINKIFMIPDSPEKKGDTVVEDWCFNMHNMTIRIFDNWDSLPSKSSPGQDVDQAIAQYGVEHVAPILADIRNPNYESSSRWFLDRAIAEIDDEDSTDLRTRLKTATQYGKNVRHPLDREEFVDLISKHYGFNPLLLSKELTTKDDTEQGFVLQIGKALLKFLHPVGTLTQGNKRYTELYSKERKTNTKVQLGSEESIANELAPIAGNLITFIDRYVGWPPFLPNPHESTTPIMKDVDRHLKHYVKEALLILSEGLPDINGTSVKQGYHVVSNPNGNYVEYIVNGTTITRLDRDPSDSTKITTVELEGPSDPANSIIFDLSSFTGGIEPAWWSHGFTQKNFDAQLGMNLADLYRDILRFYNTGFKLKNQRTTTQFMAAAAMVLPVQDIFARPTYAMITGTSGSGKSTLTATLAGHSEKNAIKYAQIFSPIRILYSSKIDDAYTLASVASKGDRDSRLYVLDEFESNDSERGPVVDSILELHRNLINGEALRSTMGAAGGGGREQVIRHPVIYVAVTLPNKSVSINRLTTIETIPHPAESLDPPIEETLLKELGPDFIESIRHRLNVGMYQYAEILGAMQAEVSRDIFAMQSELSAPMLSRQLAAMVGPITVMRLAGLDWKQFLKDYVEEHHSTLQNITHLSESDDLVNAIFRNPIIRRDNGAQVSMMSMLANPEARADLSSSEYGCYFDASTKLLLLLMDVTVAKLIPYDKRRFGRSCHQIKATLGRHPQALTNDEITTSGVLLRASRVLGAGIRAKDVSVFRVAPWIEESDASRTSMAARIENARASTTGGGFMPPDLAAEFKNLKLSE